MSPCLKGAMNGRCLNCRTRAVADRHHRESWINSNYLPCTLAWKCLELMFGSWCLREGAIVLECSNAGQGLKLHREQVEALRPVEITALDQGEEPEAAGHAPRQRCVLMIGAAKHGIVDPRNS